MDRKSGRRNGLRGYLSLGIHLVIMDSLLWNVSRLFFVGVKKKKIFSRQATLSLTICYYYLCLIIMQIRTF